MALLPRCVRANRRSFGQDPGMSDPTPAAGTLAGGLMPVLTAAFFWL